MLSATSDPDRRESLDPIVCRRARRSRDARFDGQFFVGVLTTRIYCRPICPVPPPKERNVRYFPSAAAAAAAGLRPCLRCRPESSPGSPAWQGTSAIVARAMRLLSEGALDDRGEENLADSLGIGSRHLRRLFARHLGATPTAVARTRRLHFAKKLIDETSLPMTVVASCSGFGSVRRFNAVVREVYRRTPTELRRRAQRSEARDGGCTLRLGYRRPLAWTTLIGFLADRATPGVEEIRDGAYRRTIAFGDASGVIEVRPAPSDAVLLLDIRCGDPAAMLPIVDRVRRMFDLHADPRTIADHLGRDALLAPRIAAHPGVRVPGCWDGFELAVRAILGQQVTVGGATTLAGRLARLHGRPLDASDGDLHLLFPTARDLVAADLSPVGLPRTRARAIRELAGAVVRGHLAFDGTLDARTLARRLASLPGIGDWTAQYVAMRAAGDPDAFPASDLGLLQALADGNPTSPGRLRARAESWRPWRAYAAMHLWTGISNNRSR